MKIKPIYVTFEQAKLFKEKGFDVVCDKFYASNGKLCDSVYDFDEWCSAPEHWQVIEWLRIKHGIQLFLDYFYYDGFHYGCKYTKSNGDSGDIWVEGNDDTNGIDGALTPQDAYSNAFDYVLKNLI